VSTSWWHLTGKKFYLDAFDIDQDLKPDGLCPYAYAIRELAAHSIIPVVGLDRDDDHLKCVESYLLTKSASEVAIRLLPCDFDDYELLKDEIADVLGRILEVCDHVDLILDCRVIVEDKVSILAQKAVTFATAFCSNYSCRKVILTGSSLPASIADLVPPSTEKMLPRFEYHLWAAFKVGFDQFLARPVFGDYGVVSPEYSDFDLPPEMMPTVSAPKAVYSLDGHHFVVRGGRFKTHADGYGQYFSLARIIINKGFFRGPGFSAGDGYIQQRSDNIPSHGSPQTWIKNTLNAHMTYIATGVRP
jgi:hypothetical protein